MEKLSGAVDFGYLEGLVGGDPGVVREILAIFLQQAGEWRPQLSPPIAGWRPLLHTMKGATRGVGARDLGDLCERAELEGEAVLPAVLVALAAAVADIEVYCARPR